MSVATASPAPAGATRPAKRRGPAIFKGLAIALVVVGYLAGATVGTLYAAPALFYAVHKQMPKDLSLGSFGQLWMATAEDPKARRKLKLCAAPPAVLLYVLVPALLGAIGARRRELHGSARWAHGGEIHEAGLLEREPGIVVGKLNGRFLTFPGQQSVMLSAPTRSGKGVGIVIPNLLAWSDSVVVVDIKGENFARTAGFRAAHGQRVFVWAPFADDDRSHAWNPLASIRMDGRNTVGDILSISQVLYATPMRSTGTEQFFAEQARNLFLGLCLLLVETPEWPRTIGELLRQSSGKGQPLKDYLQALITARSASDRPLSDLCVDTLNRFMSTSDNTLTSILATFNAPLTVWSDPFVDAATSRSAFRLEQLRRERLSVYVIVPPHRLLDASVLLNLFFSQAINLNTQALPETDPTLRHQCLLVLDEATAMGRIGILDRAIGYLAGYNLRVLTVIQAVSQLDATYGRESARTLATNHALQILYAPREQRDANEYSEMLGTLTERSESQGRSHQYGGKGGTSRSVNVSPQRRPLLLPQEFKEIGQDRQVVVLENCKPILAEKIRYYDDPMLAPRVLAPPVIPEIDLELHRARVEQRIRAAENGEAFRIEDLAGDWGRLPRLTEDAGEREVRTWIDGFFASGALQVLGRGSADDAPSSPGGRDATDASLAAA